MRFAAIVPAVLPALLLCPAGAVAGDESRTLAGEYTSVKHEGVHPIEAVFEGTGEGRWKVLFRFELDGRQRRFAGTAEGSLSAGELRGRVQDEDRRKTFTFRGEVEDGRFRGTHAEVMGDEEAPTGTLSLGV